MVNEKIKRMQRNEVENLDYIRNHSRLMLLQF